MGFLKLTSFGFLWLTKATPMSPAVPFSSSGILGWQLKGMTVQRAFWIDYPGDGVH